MNFQGYFFYLKEYYQCPMSLQSKPRQHGEASCDRIFWILPFGELFKGYKYHSAKVFDSFALNKYDVT